MSLKCFVASIFGKSLFLVFLFGEANWEDSICSTDWQKYLISWSMKFCGKLVQK